MGERWPYRAQGAPGFDYGCQLIFWCKTMWKADSEKHAMAVNNQAKLIAVNQQSSIVLVDRDSGNELFTLRHDDGLQFAAFSFDGRTLATATGGGRIYLWHVATGSTCAHAV